MARKKPLSKKQLAQRRYAAAMRSVRARARRARGGQGAISARKAAVALRRKFGLATRRGRAKVRRVVRSARRKVSSMVR